MANSKTVDKDQEVLEYVESSLGLIEELKQANADLSQKLAEASAARVKLEKVASATPQLFTEEEIDQTISRLVDLSLVNPQSKEKVASILKGDNHSILTLLKDVSEAGLSSVESGQGIAKEANASDDPDGWLTLK